MSSERGYQLVRLTSGAHSLRSLEYGETMHPAIGPAAEAEALYVQQLRLAERLQQHRGDFVVWDVGLGGAANALAVIRAARELPCSIHLLSFDSTIEPLQFALENEAKLDYLNGSQARLRQLLDARRVSFEEHACRVRWELHVGDFPSMLEEFRSRRREEADAPPQASASSRRQLPPPSPHAILFDPFSPARNPAMWTLPLFENLFALLDPERTCALTTYSRSTMIRVALLCAGFFVGAGRATGWKEQTTIAANTPSLIDEPLDRAWLQRAGSSHSAEPMREAVYRQAVLSTRTLAVLEEHPQFRSTQGKPF